MVLPSGIIKLAGAEYQVDEFTDVELAKFEVDFGHLIKTLRTNVDTQDIADLVEENKGLLLDFVRVMKKLTGKAYEGRNTTADGLVFDFVSPVDFGSTANPKLTWEETWSATGLNNWIDDPDNTGNPFVLSKWSGMMLLGYYNAHPSPKSDGVLISKGGKTLPFRYHNWDIQNVYKEPDPIIVLPEGDIYIQQRVAKTGDDIPIPIAIKVVRAGILRKPTQSALLY